MSLGTRGRADGSEGGRGTLLVFAREPEPGRVKTRLARAVGADAACRLYEAFLSDTLAAATSHPDVRVEILRVGEGPRLDRFLARFPGVTARPQADGDLGERLAAAFDGVPTEGWPAAAIGTDAPDLPAVLYARLLDAARTVPVTIGPASDGGYWGIALARPASDLFTAGIPWGGDGVLCETLRRARAAGLRCRLLSPWQDVDTAADLDALRRRLRYAPRPACPETARVMRGM